MSMRRYLFTRVYSAVLATLLLGGGPGCSNDKIAGTADDVNSGSIVGSIMRDPRAAEDTVTVCLYRADTAKALVKRGTGSEAPLQTLKTAGTAYRFDSLAAGSYRIHVLSDGIVVGRRDDIALTRGKRDTIDIGTTVVIKVMLSVQAGENVTVTNVSIDNGKIKKLEGGYVLSVAEVDTQSFELAFDRNGVSNTALVRIILQNNGIAKFEPMTDSLSPVLTPSYESDCLVPGAIACLPFESGLADDVSGNGNHGRVVGALPATDRFNRPDAALRFNGKDDYVIVDTLRGTVAGNTPKSISGWFRSEHYSKYLQMLFGFGAQIAANNFQIGAGPLSGGIDTPYVFRVNGWGDGYDWRTGIPALRFFDGLWHQSVLVYDGSIMKLYFDGSLAAQTAGFSYVTPENPVLVIGREIDLNEWEFEGDLDDIRIFNRAITENEVKLLYNQPSR